MNQPLKPLPFTPWTFLRTVLERGAAIQQDYLAGRFDSYEQYAQRLDAAARELADGLAAAMRGKPTDAVNA